MHRQQENVRSIFPGTISARTLPVALRMVAAIIALSRLISLPAERAHSFSLHLRAPVVRRDPQRFSFVAQFEAPAEQPLRAPNLPRTPFGTLEEASTRRPLLHSDYQTEISLSRLLRHLELGIARANSSGPARLIRISLDRFVTHRTPGVRRAG